MKSLKGIMLSACAILSLIAVHAGAQGFSRPSASTSTNAIEPCGGNNFVASSTNFSPVYTKTGTPPITNPSATLVVSGTSPSDPNTGNQSTVEFSHFAAASGTISGLKIYYSIVTSNTACGYIAVQGNHMNGQPFNLQLATLGSNCYNNAANCNVSIPDDADLTSLVVSICIQAQYNNPTNPANAVIFDLWAGYATASCTH